MAQSSHKADLAREARRFEILKAAFDDEGASYDSLTTKVQILMGLQGGALLALKDNPQSLSVMFLALSLIAGLVALGLGFWYEPLLRTESNDRAPADERDLLANVNRWLSGAIKANARYNARRWYVWMASNALAIAAVILAICR